MSDLSDLQPALEMLRRGDREGARRLLTDLIRRNPAEARLWLALAACVDEPERRRFCLERALALDPDLPAARRALESLEEQEPNRPAPTTPPQASAPDMPPVDAPPDAPHQPVEVKVLPAAAPIAPARTPTPANARPNRTAGRWIILFAFVLLAAVAGLALAYLPGGLTIGGEWGLTAGWNALGLPEAHPPRSYQPPAAPATLSIRLAPTWTPTPPTEAGSATEARPTIDLFAGFSTQPVASITPLAGYRRISIGRSVRGRSIDVLRFGSGRKERMIIAGIHGGDEYNTILLANQLVEHVAAHPELVPEGYTLYILPALNPDGAARGRDPDDRLNENGVDLNRNFDTNWKSTWRSQGCASLPGAGGAGPGSEPETKALKRFLSERRVEALINYHSAGLGVFPSGAPAHPESIRLARAIAAISRYAYPPLDTGCEYTGTLVDWAAENGVIAAVDLELNSVESSEFDANLKILELLMRFDVDRPEPSTTPTANLTPFPTATRTRVPTAAP